MRIGNELPGPFGRSNIVKRPYLSHKTVYYQVDVALYKVRLEYSHNIEIVRLPAEADGDNFTFTKHLSVSKLPTGGAPPAWLDHKQFQVENDGIYRGVPFYETSYNGKTAIVAGANGISGAHMLRAMARHPSIWLHMYALSRRPPRVTLPAEFVNNVSHHPIDLLRPLPKWGKIFATQGLGIGRAPRLLSLNEH